MLESDNYPFIVTCREGIESLIEDRTDFQVLQYHALVSKYPDSLNEVESVGLCLHHRTPHIRDQRDHLFTL